MKFLKSYFKLVDNLIEKIGYWSSWLTTLLVLVVCYDVFTRYILNESSVGVQELEWHIFSVIFLLAAAYTYKIDDHVRVDVIYTKYSEKGKAWINFLGVIFFLIPLCAVVVYTSEHFVLTSFQMGETSPDAGGLPARFILKALIPFSFILIFLQGISEAFKSFLKITNNSESIKESN